MANLTFLLKMTKAQNSQNQGHQKLFLITRHGSILFKPHIGMTLLNPSKIILLEASNQHDKFEPKQLDFGKPVYNLKGSFYQRSSAALLIGLATSPDSNK